MAQPVVVMFHIPNILEPGQVDHKSESSVSLQGQTPLKESNIKGATYLLGSLLLCDYKMLGLLPSEI